MNNSSLYAADRVTHLKIVAVSLVASIVFLVVAIAARTSLDTAGSRAPRYRGLRRPIRVLYFFKFDIGVLYFPFQRIPSERGGF